VVDHAVVVRLADIAAIPDAHREQFARHLQKAVHAARRRGGDWQPAPRQSGAIDQIAHIAATGRAFFKALQHSPLIEDQLLAARVSWRADIASTIGRLRRGRGRPPRTFSTEFERFVASLLLAVRAAGGRPSFDRKRRSGRLVDLLVELRPHLPPGFVPEELPWAKLERLCPDAARIAKTTTAKNRP
jgi:hypothetical protein